MEQKASVSGRPSDFATEIVRRSRRHQEHLYYFFLERRQKLCRFFIRQIKRKKRVNYRVLRGKRKLPTTKTREEQQATQAHMPANVPQNNLSKKTKESASSLRTENNLEENLLPTNDGSCCRLELLNIIFAEEADLSWL